jgi:hypothetical protein
MGDRRLRGRIADEAARLLHEKQEQEFVRAKRKAARLLGFRFKPRDLPSNREISHRLDRMEAEAGPPIRLPSPRQLAIEGLRWLRRFADKHPRLGWPLRPAGSSEAFLDVHLVTDDDEAMLGELQRDRLNYEVQQERAGLDGRRGVPVLVRSRWPVRFFVYPTPVQPIENDQHSLDRPALEAELLRERPSADLDAELIGLHDGSERLQYFRLLLLQLEEMHPVDEGAGDLLHHALQAFDRTAAERPYDEEFMTAALLHDVGRIGEDENESAEDLLSGVVTNRTLWLIQHLDDEGMTAAAAPSDDDWRDLVLLRELIAESSIPGAETRSLDEALKELESFEESR